ncbi:Uncharacterised protein [Mycobacterium tuberculosis]|nr:Uncharacterised protein [Mycobacterium tuberculosis]
MGGAAEHGVVRRLPVLAEPACFLVAADQEDGVVGGGRDRQHHEQVGREGREPNDPVETEESHAPAGGEQPEHHHRQHDRRRDDRPVDQQQHHDDHGERDRLDHLQTTVAGLLLIGDQRGRTGDVHLDTGWRRKALDDGLDRFHGLVGQ